ncbi:hypothetical protein [Agromyces albus]|uniref:DUF4232 domain-containing protein n=1 Tax=Agromyces albus TaxID=205332 RepID=A0A4Q2KVJ5_9MICO|nr:hypothetical protein [Agromyces albus]RXZ67842.1 hypothetical protein ESP51_16155 [Agromyces albus]
MRRARRLSRFAFVAALLTVPALLAACTGAAPGQPGDSSGSGEPSRLVASIKQGRLDIEARRLVVRLSNTGDTALTIEGFEFEAATLAPGMVRTKPLELAPGETIDVRLDLSTSVCDVEVGPASVVADVSAADEADAADGAGAGTRVTLTPDDPFDTLARINAAECLGGAVAEVATFTMPEHLTSTGSGAERRASIDVLVEPAASGTDSLHVERVYGTTLLNAEDGIDWTLGIDVAPGDAPFTLSLPVRPARCDAHAIADDKRGTILPFAIAAGEHKGRLDHPSSDTLKAELYAYVAERCGLELPGG